LSVIEGLIQQLDTSQNKRQLIEDIEIEFGLADDSIEQMDMVVKSTFGGHALDVKVKNFRLQLDKLKEKMNSKIVTPYNQQRAKILAGKEVLHRTDDRLKECVRITGETEDNAVKTYRILIKDGEALENTYGMLDEVDNKMDHARSILGRMGLRVISNKLILWFIILVLLVSISGIIYFKWIGPLLKVLEPILMPQEPPAHVPQPQPVPIPVPAPF